MLSTPQPHSQGDVIAYAVQTEFNLEQARYHFKDTNCKRSGWDYLEFRFKCTSTVVDRKTGKASTIEFYSLADGTIQPIR